MHTDRVDAPPHATKSNQEAPTQDSSLISSPKGRMGSTAAASTKRKHLFFGFPPPYTISAEQPKQSSLESPKPSSQTESPRPIHWSGTSPPAIQVPKETVSSPARAYTSLLQVVGDELVNIKPNERYYPNTKTAKVNEGDVNEGFMRHHGGPIVGRMQANIKTANENLGDQNGPMPTMAYMHTSPCAAPPGFPLANRVLNTAAYASAWNGPHFSNPIIPPMASPGPSNQAQGQTFVSPVNASNGPMVPIPWGPFTAAYASVPVPYMVPPSGASMHTYLPNYSYRPMDVNGIGTSWPAPTEITSVGDARPTKSPDDPWNGPIFQDLLLPPTTFGASSSAVGAVDESNTQDDSAIVSNTAEGYSALQPQAPVIDHTNTNASTSHSTVEGATVNGTAATTAFDIGSSDAIIAAGVSSTAGLDLDPNQFVQAQQVVNINNDLDITFATVFDDWSGSSLNDDAASREEARRWQASRDSA